VPATLYDLIPRDEKPGNDVLPGRFLDYVEGRRLQLYPAQESVLRDIQSGRGLPQSKTCRGGCVPLWFRRHPQAGAGFFVGVTGWLIRCSFNSA
jgi:hypothetical protein